MNYMQSILDKAKTFVKQSKNHHLMLITTLLTVITSSLIIGGYLIYQSVKTRATGSKTPKNIRIKRFKNVAVVVFRTDSEVLAIVECSSSEHDGFKICGRDDSRVRYHQIKLKLNSEDKEYFFKIKIGGKEYNREGKPYTIPSSQNMGFVPQEEFPENLLGICEGEGEYNPFYDLNSDGCILMNDVRLASQ